MVALARLLVYQRVLASYRIERALFLTRGPAWPLLKVLLSPMIFLLRPWIAAGEINYHADIGSGLRVLHPSLGVVISGKTQAGKNLVLVGGNCIGGRRALKNGDLVIGDNVTLGANAVILGPVRIGNKVQIGVGAVVITDVAERTWPTTKL